MPTRKDKSRHSSSKNKEVEQVKKHLTFSPNGNQPSSKVNGSSFPYSPQPRQYSPIPEDEEGDNNVYFLFFIVAVLAIVASFGYQSLSLLAQTSWMVLTFNAFGEKDFLLAVITGLILAVCLLIYSWTVVYYDSLVPGKIPPTPISPSKYRRQSGHTFHLNYVMGILFSIIFFVHFVVHRNTQYHAL